MAVLYAWFTWQNCLLGENDNWMAGIIQYFVLFSNKSSISSHREAHEKKYEAWISVVISQERKIFSG